MNKASYNGANDLSDLEKLRKAKDSAVGGFAKGKAGKALRKEAARQKLSSISNLPEGTDLASDGSKAAAGAGAGLELAKATGMIQGGGTADNIASGALAGAAFGPYGAAIGGAVGGLTGALGARSKRKAAVREANAQAADIRSQGIINSEQERGARVSSALQRLSGAFSQNLNNIQKVRL